MKINKKIIWERWIDPFCSNISDFYPDSILKDKKDNEEKSFLEQEQENINPILSYDDPSPYELLGKGKYKGKVIFTPVGILPIMDHHYVSNNFNLWIGNTNFDITSDIALQIESVVGVETLEIYTRYRFRIGIGKAFDSAEVKTLIQTRLCGIQNSYKNTINDQNLKEEIEQTIEELKKKYKYWAMCIFPNGEKKIAHSPIKDEDFIEEMDKMSILQKMCGGILYSYDE